MSAASGLRLAASGGYRLAWQDNARNETGFVIERSRRRDFAVVDRTFFRAANSTSFVDTTAAGGGVYYYRVRAVNAGGDSGYSNAASLSPVAGRYVFYNRSARDGNDVAAGWADDGAIATDKRALLPGQAASSANFTSYGRGISGMMIDIASLASDVSLTAADFTLEVGSPGKWHPVSVTPSVTVRPGAGAAAPIG